MITSMIIPTLNNKQQTKRCVESIRTYTISPYELIFFDNGSTDGTLEWLDQQTDVQVLKVKENIGFAKACNRAATIAKGENLLFLNNDTIVSHRWLELLLRCLYSSEQIGFVGPTSNTVIPPQIKSFKWKHEAHYHKFAQKNNRANANLWKPLSALSGFCLLTRRKVWESLQGFDELFTPGGFEDIDLSYRTLKSGLQLYLAGDVFVFHEGNVTFKSPSNQMNIQSIAKRNRQKFIEKWGFNPDRLILNQEPGFLPGQYATSHPHHFPYESYLPSGWYGKDAKGNLYWVEGGVKRAIKHLHTCRYFGITQKRIASYKLANEMNAIPKGTPLNELKFPSGFPSCFLARDANKGLYRVAHGVFYPIANKAAGLALGFHINEALPLLKKQLRKLGEGWAIEGNGWDTHELPDHFLYQGTDNKIYYAEGQRLRLIQSPTTYARYGWYQKRIVPLPQKIFSRTSLTFAIP